MAASKKEKQAAAQAATAHEAGLKDATAAQDHSKVLEAELQDLRDKHVEEARNRQAEEDKMKAPEDDVRYRDTELTRITKAQGTEHGRLEMLE